MTHAMRIHSTGGPEVLSWDTVDVPSPGHGEVTVRHTAVGLNYIDTYHRSGLYPVPSLPSGLGLEAAGVIEAVGEGVQHFGPGDRVAYCTGPIGAYAERRTMTVDTLITLPDSIDDQMAAAVLLQGLTAEFLLRRTYPVRPGETILIHAAAGGVGVILCQWAKALGAVVIGTVGNEAKAALAQAHGCDHVIDYTREDFTARVKEITEGDGVVVVYDGVGAATFEGSLDCLKPRGMMVSFGNASGPVKAFDAGLLAQKGSLYLTRPTLFHYCSTPEALRTASEALFAAIDRGAIKARVDQTFPLAEAAQAHRALEARATTGATVLLP